MRKFRFYGVALLGLLALLVAPPGHAVVLNPGDSNIAPDVFPAISGTIEADTGVEPFIGKDINGTAFFAGNFRQIVVLDSVTGFLDFIYEVEVTTGPNGVGRLSTTNFQNQFTDVGFCPTCLDVINLGGANDSTGTNKDPQFVDRSVGPGSTISFDFVGEAGAGTDTDPLVIKTHSKVFAFGSTSLLDGGTANLRSYDPTPEPAFGGMMLGGLVLGGLLLKRRLVRA
jgi:hypothetical protein